MTQPRAIVADDEPALASHLVQALSRAWPELLVVGVVHDGAAALDLCREQKPDVAFLDIRMPGLDGLEVARHIADSCHVVIVSAYDNHAVEAFEAAAIDYVLKPATDERLGKTVTRLRKRMATKRESSLDIDSLIAQLRGSAVAVTLRWIKASVGDTVRVFDVRDVIFFEALDKYTRVVTAEGEGLIRTSLKQLAEQLDPEAFWQVHRAYIVQARAVRSAKRDPAGNMSIALAGQTE
ncbi:MAG: LytTR family DNA-binding domain-containing protein, partial [Planctomycetota bacterium]